MLDDTDVKIIKILAQNARMSNVRLAHQLGIAVSTVSRRIDTLIQENIISIKALPNHYKLGYKASAVIGLDVDLKKIDDVCSKLMENNHIALLVTTFGRFDMLAIVDYTNYDLLNHFIKQELPQIAGVIRVEPFFVSETTKRYSGMFKHGEKTNTVVNLDEIDNRLIEELGKDGRIAYSQLASDLGISIATVSRRVSSLIKEELIKITVLPNAAIFGYLAIAGVVLQTDPVKINDIATALARRVETHVVMKLTNTFDIFFIIDFPTPEKLYKYLKEDIARIYGVLNMETFVLASSPHLSIQTLSFPRNAEK